MSYAKGISCKRRGNLAIFFIFLLAGHQVGGVASITKLIQITAFWASRGPNTGHGVSALRTFEIDYEVENLAKVVNQFVELTNNTQLVSGLSTAPRCCCKRVDTAESCEKKNRFRFQTDDGAICCKARKRCKARGSTLKTPVEDFNISHKVGPDGEMQIVDPERVIAGNCEMQTVGPDGEKLDRQRPFRAHCTAEECAAQCSYALARDCIMDDTLQSCPDNLLCKGTWIILCNWKMIGNDYADTTNTGGVANAGAGTLDGMVNTADTEALTELLGQAGFLGPAGSIAGAIAQILTLISGMCSTGIFQTLGSCQGGLSMSALTLAIAAICIAFTGLGAPFALVVGSIAIIVRKIGPQICKHGLRNCAIHIFLGVPYENITKDLSLGLTLKDNIERFMTEELKWPNDIVTRVLFGIPVDVVIWVLKVAVGLVEHLVLCVWALLTKIPMLVYRAVTHQVDESCCALRAIDGADLLVDSLDEQAFDDNVDEAISDSDGVNRSISSADVADVADESTDVGS